MKSSLKERFEQLGHIRAAGRVPSGSAASFALRLPQPPMHDRLETIPAIRALVRRGMDVLEAKRAIEALLEGSDVTVEVPAVENPRLLIAELGDLGVEATLSPLEAADVVAHGTR
jgi:hypothetical protein